MVAFPGVAGVAYFAAKLVDCVAKLVEHCSCAKKATSFFLAAQPAGQGQFCVHRTIGLFHRFLKKKLSNLPLTIVLKAKGRVCRFPQRHHFSI